MHKQHQKWKFSNMLNQFDMAGQFLAGTNDQVLQEGNNKNKVDKRIQFRVSLIFQLRV